MVGLWGGGYCSFCLCIAVAPKKSDKESYNVMMGKYRRQIEVDLSGERGAWVGLGGRPTRHLRRMVHGAGHQISHWEVTKI